MTDPTDEELRIAVAAALKLRGSTEPDWPHDLNACARFEKTLTEAERRDYQHALCVELFGTFGEYCKASDDETEWRFLSANPRQRCLAFLAVKGRPSQNFEPFKKAILRNIVKPANPTP